MQQALIIIDVQTDFGPISGDVTTAIKAEIRSFKERLLPIIVIEMADYGPTKRRIGRALGKYPLAAYVTKEGHNGSGLVRPALTALGFPLIRTARVCGLYTSICVAETAEGLADIDEFDVVVVDRACFDFPKTHDSQIETWRAGTVARITVA